MTLEQAKDRINELKPKIEYYTRKYYEDEQVISDFEFDMLMKHMEKLLRLEFEDYYQKWNDIKESE